MYLTINDGPEKAISFKKLSICRHFLFAKQIPNYFQDAVKPKTKKNRQKSIARHRHGFVLFSFLLITFLFFKIFYKFRIIKGPY